MIQLPHKLGADRTMRRLPATVLCVVALALPTLAGAQTVLTPDEAVRLALLNSRELAALEGRAAAGEHAVAAAATGYRDPELRFEDVSTKYWDASGNQEIGVGLRWQPPRLGELQAEAQKERVDQWRVKVDAQQVRVRVAADVRKALAECAMWQEAADLAEAGRGLEEQRLVAVDQLVALGQRPLLDRVKTVRRVMKARQEAAQALQRRASARQRLRALTGLAGDVVPLPGEPPQQDLDPEAVRAVAVRERAEAELARQRARLADREWEAARHRMAPWFGFVELGYHHETANPDWGELRLGIDLPFSRWNRAAVKGAGLARTAATEGEAAARQTLEAEVDEALAAYRGALAVLRSLSADGGALLGRAGEILAAARRDATVARDDVIDLELADLEARLAVLEARHEVAATAAELCAAAGVTGWEGLAP